MGWSRLKQVFLGLVFSRVGKAGTLCKTYPLGGGAEEEREYLLRWKILTWWWRYKRTHIMCTTCKPCWLWKFHKSFTLAGRQNGDEKQGCRRKLWRKTSNKKRKTDRETRCLVAPCTLPVNCFSRDWMHSTRGQSVNLRSRRSFCCAEPLRHNNLKLMSGSAVTRFAYTYNFKKYCYYLLLQQLFPSGSRVVPLCCELVCVIVFLFPYPYLLQLKWFAG